MDKNAPVSGNPEGLLFRLISRKNKGRRDTAKTTGKKFAALILTVLLFLAVSAAYAAGGQDDAEITALLENAGIASPAQLSRRDGVAACLAEAEGQRRLIVLEKQDGAWKIVIDNPSALFQDGEAPELKVDEDGIRWSYRMSDDEELRYRSLRDKAGVWGPVEQYYGETDSDGIVSIINTMWDDANGGEIVRTFSRENDSAFGHGIISMHFFTAPWLADAVCLADFDAARFPPLLDDNYFYFENDRFLRDSAAALLPDCTCLNGIMKDGSLHFLVSQADGSTAYVICEYGSHREPLFFKTSPLPAGTELGHENFTDSLWIDKRCVSLQLLPEQYTMCLDCVYDDTSHEADDNILYFGYNTVWSGASDQQILYGLHPWSSLESSDWTNPPHTLEEAGQQMDSGRFAVVSNPKSSDRLHLRERADKESRSTAKYYNGTPVTVLGEKGAWARVAIGNQTGYMMKEYLTFGKSGKPLRLDTSAMPNLFSRTELLKVYTEPQTGQYNYHAGTGGMKIIGLIGEKWYHVWFPRTGEYGYVLQSDLWEGNG